MSDIIRLANEYEGKQIVVCRNIVISTSKAHYQAGSAAYSIKKEKLALTYVASRRVLDGLLKGFM
ncbi:hypothetical protein KL866_15050 [Alteromonas sp. ALT199]|uniref:hypothetical protein n=1 Tax=unclassified Alteromonas TaxID=2614992 RepID=UPI00046CB0BC|nr:hypothetical protein [Alteromonas sp. ALT199]MBT3136392.1 hypothetical protein [Alteromonas sp. ALT199]